MSGMKIIKPIAITPAMLTGSTVAEPDTGETVWNSATAYTEGQQVIRTSTHMIYKCAVANTNFTPEANLTGATPKWVEVGPTNRWAMFDRKVGTATTAASTLTIVLRPGGISGLAMLELVGREAVVTMKDEPGGAVVYSRTIDLDGSIIGDIYDWFFGEYEQRTDFVLTDLPAHYTDCELTVTLTGTSGVACGVFQVGQVIEIGTTLSGATAGIANYGSNEPDTFGNIDFVERGYAKRNNFKVLTAKADFNKIYRRLAQVRSTPIVMIGSEEIGLEPLIGYGIVVDFSIEVAYSTHHLCDLEFLGMI